MSVFALLHVSKARGDERPAWAVSMYHDIRLFMIGYFIANRDFSLFSQSASKQLLDQVFHKHFCLGETHTQSPSSQLGGSQ